MRISDWSSYVCSSDLSANPVLVTLNLGNNLPAAPDASGHARLSHSITFGDAWRLKSSVDATYKGKEFKRLDNALSAQTAACTLINQIGSASCRERVWQYV